MFVLETSGTEQQIGLSVRGSEGGDRAGDVFTRTVQLVQPLTENRETGQGSNSRYPDLNRCAENVKTFPRPPTTGIRFRRHSRSLWSTPPSMPEFGDAGPEGRSMLSCWLPRGSQLGGNLDSLKSLLAWQARFCDRNHGVQTAILPCNDRSFLSTAKLGGCSRLWTQIISSRGASHSARRLPVGCKRHYTIRRSTIRKPRVSFCDNPFTGRYRKNCPAARKVNARRLIVTY